jgi:hypothetical protein
MRVWLVRLLLGSGGIICAAAWGSAPAFAQNVSNLSSPPVTAATRLVEEAENPTRIAVPVAVSSDLGGEGQRGVAPTVGFQIWRRDKFFVGSFFTLSATDPSVTEQYGAFVLNPPLKGHSFYVSGNYLHDILKKDADGKSFLLGGVGARWGTTSASFEFTPSGGTALKRSGFGIAAAVTAQLATRTFDVAMGDTTGEFQMGVEMGPTWRLLGGDLSQDDSFRRQVLGTDKSSFSGFEFTFFTRVNSVQPFARFSTFSRPNGTVINGFTGRQVVWGVNVASSLFQTKAE